MRCTDFLSDSYLPFKYNAWPDMPVLLCTYRYDAEQAKSLNYHLYAGMFSAGTIGLYIHAWLIIHIVLLLHACCKLVQLTQASSKHVQITHKLVQLTQASSKHVQITHKLVTGFILYCITSLFKSCKLGKLVTCLTYA
jgi:hypothetical protein